MSNYSAANAQSDMDTVARMYELLESVLGTGSETGTVSKGALNIYDRILDDADSTDDYSIIANLAQPANDLREAGKIYSGSQGYANTFANIVRKFIVGLQTELGGSIDSWLTSNSRRVHEYFGQAFYEVTGQRLSRANIFPTTVEMGTLSRSGSTWAFSDGSAVASTIGPAQIEAYVPTGTIGSATCTVQVTVETLAGASESKTAYLPNASASGASAAFGTTGSIYVDVTAATCSGGTDGDIIALRTITKRDISSACD